MELSRIAHFIKPPCTVRNKNSRYKVARVTICKYLHVHFYLISQETVALHQQASEPLSFIDHSEVELDIELNNQK